MLYGSDPDFQRGIMSKCVVAVFILLGSELMSPQCRAPLRIANEGRKQLRMDHTAFLYVQFDIPKIGIATQSVRPDDDTPLANRVGTTHTINEHLFQISPIAAYYPPADRQSN